VPDGNASLRNLFAARRARVLVADDVITNQQVAVGMLQQMGLRADAVANGAEALAALNALPYDLVLMDVQMPLMDGLEATRQIRLLEAGSTRGSPGPSLNGQRLPAGAMQGDRENCLRAGMDDFVPKPLMPRALAQVLAKWLPKEEPPPSENKNVPQDTHSILVASSSSPVLDMSALLSRLMGDKEMAGKVLDGFLADMPAQILSLLQFVEADNAPDARKQAHKIKGASAAISGEALRALASEMERAADAGNLAALKAGATDLDEQFLRLKQAIASNRSA
jgi:CheY-like chemotaxis protein/HPt (histidine-containing phosphotransfer) domain-containing protein